MDIMDARTLTRFIKIPTRSGRTKPTKAPRHLQKTTVFSIKQNTDSKLFRNKDDRKEFVSIVKRNKEKFGYDIYGYCLLDDDEFVTGSSE